MKGLGTLIHPYSNASPIHTLVHFEMDEENSSRSSPCENSKQNGNTGKTALELKRGLWYLPVIFGVKTIPPWVPR